MFYDLLLETRRRHGLAPQPRKWFRNLANGFGERLTITAAFHRNRAIGAALTIRMGTTLTYKYGVSAASEHSRGAMPLLSWHLIQQAKCDGAVRLDLGRTDVTNDGLATFKDRLGASRLLAAYRRYPQSPAFSTSPGARHLVRVIVSWLPNRALSGLGSLAYRHLA